jgi:hypothetical protein
MDKQINEIKRGEQADNVLSNPEFISAVSKVREGIVSSMTSSALGDAETHNRLVIGLQLLSQIEKQLKDVVATGKMATLQVNDKRGLFR